MQVLYRLSYEGLVYPSVSRERPRRPDIILKPFAPAQVAVPLPVSRPTGGDVRSLVPAYFHPQLMERETGWRCHFLSRVPRSKPFVGSPPRIGPAKTWSGKRGGGATPCFAAHGWRRSKPRPRGFSPVNYWRGKRGSHPRPSAWKADGLPIELFPRR